MKFFRTIPFLLFGLLLLLKPDVCKDGISVGLLLCGNTIIPALFPFAVCVLFLTRYPLPKKIDRFLSRIGTPFHFSGEELFLFFFSLVGGYPIGAKLLEQSVNNGSLKKEEAEKILPCFIHSGPAFLMFAIGQNIYRSTFVGFLFVIAQISSAILLALFCSKNKSVAVFPRKKTISLDFSENFVLSTSEAANSIFGICSFVLIFSVLTAYGTELSRSLSFVKNFLPFLEVTCGIHLTKNIYFIGFLVGFSGISVWFQVFVFAKNYLKNFSRFLFFRILHGVLFSGVLALEILIFKPEISAYSTNSKTLFSPLYSNLSLTFCLLGTILLLLLSFTAKKEGRNFEKDMI